MTIEPNPSAAAASTVYAGRAEESADSAVSWAAIIGGAFAAAASTVILLAAGAGLGLASVSPWPGVGASPAAFTVIVGIWLIVVQWLASGLGGYLTGRLRTRWTATHTHEVFFRDTAHGFLTWSVATVMVALLLMFSASLAGGAGARAAATATNADPSAPSARIDAYDVDALFRTARPDDSPSAGATRAEAARILARTTLKVGSPADDRAYLSQLVAARTGLSAADARTRVEATISRLRQAADDARKSAAAFSVFTAISMLIGALIACVAATIGGQQRDEHAAAYRAVG